MSQRILSIEESSLFISHRYDKGDKEYRFTVNGIISRSIDLDFSDVNLHLAFRDEKGRAIHKEESYISDCIFEGDQLEFSANEYVPAKIFKKAVSVDFWATGEIRTKSKKLAYKLKDSEVVESSSS
ncbi:MAG: hypothetical protein HN348_30130 [Proteobacteria bacterium]|jgi:hypothetical protein|nr:hypothetical protein [Pseudomonadota bacterium]